MDEEDYSSLPLEEKIVHKVWKVRLEAYGELVKQFESSRSHEDECFTRFNNNPAEFKRIITDANVVAQETGILALLKFLEFGGTTKNVERLKSAGIISSLCEKGLSSSRAGTKEKTMHSILYFVEISDEPNSIVEDILPFFTNRLPKLVSGCVICVTLIVENFGCKIINPNPIISLLPKLFGHADRTVRAESTKLTVEIYKWVRGAIQTLLFPLLKPIQQKDLTAAFAKVAEESPSQVRFTRRQQEEIARKEAEAAAAAAAASAGDSNEMLDSHGGDIEMSNEQEPEFNPFDLMDPVEILSKLPEDLNSRISSAKWKDRKEVLEEVHTVLEKSVKLQNDDYSELVRIFAKNMKDANLQVVQLAANCIEFLVNGLQSNFNKYQSIVLGPILERTKEKKANIAEALDKALDAIFKYSSLLSVLEDTVTNMQSKIPQAKIASTNYLKRCLSETKIPPTRSEIDSIMKTGVKTLSDSQEPVRNAATEMIATLMKITGERELGQFMEKVDSNRKAKVLAYVEKATVKCKAGDGQVASKSSQPQPKPKLVAQAPKRAEESNSNTSLKPSFGNLPRPSSAFGGKTLSLPSTSSIKKPRAPVSSTLLPSKRGATSPVKRNESNVVKRPMDSPNNGVPSLAIDSLSSAEKEELQALRQQKQLWKMKELNLQQQCKLYQDELDGMTRELIDLRSKNDDLSSDYKSIQTTLRQKDNQILRLGSDLESSKLKIRDLEQEIEMQKLDYQQQKQFVQHQQKSMAEGYNSAADKFEPLTSSIGQSSVRRESLNNSGVTSPYLNRRSYQIHDGHPRINSGELTSRVNRLSIGPEFKENESHTSPTGITTSPRPIREHTNTYTSNLNKETLDFGGENDDSWRRAAEVTNQLKARIEKMKARSRANFS